MKEEGKRERRGKGGVGLGKKKRWTAITAGRTVGPGIAGLLRPDGKITAVPYGGYGPPSPGLWGLRRGKLLFSKDESWATR